jgi:1-acyl-sn-glycerol-3-phosphate acyltransferase
MVYEALRALIAALLAVFYRRVEVVGVERVPRHGPLIVAANHQNALVDPMVVMAALPRTLRPVAKAPLFRHPLIAPFLKLVGAIPVERRQEAGAGALRNEAAFAAVADALGRGGAILIFPEGGSQPEPVLMPLRTGTARMMATATAAGMRVTLLPVGLVFHEPGTFRTGRALVIVGEPVDVADLSTGDEAGIRAVTERLAAALRAVMVEAQNRDTLRLLSLLETIAAEGAARDAASRAAWMRGAIETYRRLQTTAPERAERFRIEVERYAKDLELAGVTPTQPGRTYRAGAVWRFTLREGIALAGGLPAALVGMVLHVLPYQATALAVRWLTDDADMAATYKLLAGAVLYPLLWAAETWLGWWLGGVPLALAVVLAIVPTGFFALTWRDRLARFAREARAFTRFLVDRALDRQLAARREAIRAEMGALRRLADDTRPAGG